MKWLVIFIVTILAFVLIAFRQQKTGMIRGRIFPQNGALNIWAVSDQDTGHTAVMNGEFEIKKLRPGRYRVIAEGLRPYKVTTRPDVILNDSAIVDIGTINLDQ